MSQLNFKQILSGDNLSTVVDKLNYNFDQIVLNGGGPQGLRGIIGAPGLPGAQGLKGESGPTGEAGTHIYVDGATPGDYPFGTGGEVLPRIGDIYIETDPTYLKVYELNATGGGSYWRLVETITAPSSSWLGVYDQTNSAFDGIGNDPSIATKLFIGSTSSFDQGTVGDANTFFDSAFPPRTLKAELSSPSAFFDSVLTVSGAANQFRILSNGLSGATGSPESLTLNRGGISHSLELGSYGPNTYQVYRITNADVLGEKAFVLNLNSSGLNPSLYIDLNNRIATGAPQLSPLIAQLSVKDSTAIGSFGFYTGATFSSNQGLVVEGNLAIGLNNNSYGTIVAKGSTYSTGIFDVSSSVGTPNYSSLTIGSDVTSGSNPRSWIFFHNAQNSATNANYGSLNLIGVGLGTFVSSMYFSLTGGSPLLVRPSIGVSNTNPIGIFEVGYLDSKRSNISLGVATGSVFQENLSGHIGFNLHRGMTSWIRRGNGASNAGRTVWSTMNDSSLNISYFGSTGGETASSTDAGVYDATRNTLIEGSYLSSDVYNTRSSLSLSTSGLGMGVLFPATGSTGSGYGSENFRRYVSIFGGGPVQGNSGTPMIATTNGLTQSNLNTASGAGIESIFPQYTFYGNDLSGLYLAQGTTFNSTAWPLSPDYSVGLAQGGTVGISIHGSGFMNNGVRIGLYNRNPLERVHIGENLVIHDGGVGFKYFGYNAYWNSSGYLRRILGGTSSGGTMSGYAIYGISDSTYTNSQINTWNGFRYMGGALKLEVGPANLQTITSDMNPVNGLNYRGALLQTPSVGPNGYNNLAPYVPQLLLGLNNTQDTDGGNYSLKRGTIAVAAQGRTKPSTTAPFGVTIEDYYNIGLYSRDGYPVAGIAVSGGNFTTSTANTFTLNFMGNGGDVISQDATILYADSHIYLNRNYQKRVNFGYGYRLGINEVPNWINSPLPSTVSCDIAPLTVTPIEDYYADSQSPVPAAIFRGTVIIDTSKYGGSNGRNEGLYFRQNKIWGKPGGKGATGLSNQYAGDWSIQYAVNDGTKGSPANTRSGLNFWKPGISNAFLWLDDEGGVGVNTDKFSYVSTLYEHIFNDEGLGGFYGTPVNNVNWRTKLAVGETLSFRLAVDGAFRCRGIQVASDMRLKNEILRISPEKSLKAIQKLSPVLYTWKDDGKLASGFFAQEIEKVIPEAVFKMENGDLEDGQYSLEFWPFIAHLVGAVKAQQTLIEAKDEKIKNLEERLSKIEQFLSKLDK